MGSLMYLKVLQGSIIAISVCMCCLFSFSGCGDEGAMGYVVEIVDKGAGQCTYYLTYTKGGTSRDFEMITACGHYTVGEGIIIPKK